MAVNEYGCYLSAITESGSANYSDEMQALPRDCAGRGREMSGSTGVAAVAALQAASDASAPPFDALTKAVVKDGFWSPAGERCQARRAGYQGTHLGMLRADSSTLANDRLVAAGHLAESFYYIADFDLDAIAGIVNGAELRARRAAQGEKGAHRVADEGEITCRAEIAKVYLGAGRVEHLADRRWNHRAFALARAEGVERAERNCWYAVRAGEGLDHLVGTDLTCGIGRLAMQWMVLGDRLGLRRAINFAGRSVDETLHRAGASRFQQVERAVDVDINAGLRRDIGVGNANQCGQMKDDIVALGEAAHLHHVAHITELDAHGGACLLGDFIEPSAGSEGTVERECGDLGAGAHQGLSQMRAYKAVGASHENPLADKVIAAIDHGCALITPASNSSTEGVRA